MKTARSNFAVLIKKDMKELLKSSQLLVFLAVCTFFSILSPLSARYMPEVLAMVGETQNIIISIPEVTYRDALLQYIQNFSQLVVIVIIFLFMGSIAKEKDQGTMAYLLVKPVSRSQILLSKAVTANMLMLIGIIAAMVCTGIYTQILFSEFPAAAFIKGNVYLLLYYITITGITLAASSICKKPFTSAVAALGVWLFAGAVGSIPVVGQYSFTKLAEQAMLAFDSFPQQMPSVLGALVISITALALGIIFLERWEPAD